MERPDGCPWSREMCEIQRQAPAHPNDQRLVTLMSNLRGVKHNCSSIGWKTRSPRRRSRLALPTRCHLNEQSVGCGTKLLKVLAGRSPRRRSRLALSSPCHRDEQLRGCEKQLFGVDRLIREEWAGPGGTAIPGQPVAKAEQAPDTSPSSKNQFNIVVAQWATYQILS